MANRICSYNQSQAAHQRLLRIGTALVLAFLLCSTGASAGESGWNEKSNLPASDKFAARARRSYEEAKTRLDAEPANPDAAWQFARACFDLAEYATNNTQRAQIAKEGIAVSRQLINRHPSLAQASYYLGLNLGQLARTQTIEALHTVEEMEHAFKRALELDVGFDYAGPDRSLGLLYLQAPGWPVSIGDRRKARRHLEHAVKQSPDYPDNRLCLIEAYLKWNEISAAINQMRALEELCPRATNQFAGDQWEPAWADWNSRLELARKRLKLDDAN
jgi:tetratricopeptide (TPR) repeat protein